MKSCAPIALADASISAREARGPAEADVVGDGAGEQEVLLGDGDDRSVEVVRIEVAQVDAVERDLT